MLLVSAAQGEPAVSMHVSPPLGPPSRLPSIPCSRSSQGTGLGSLCLMALPTGHLFYTRYVCQCDALHSSHPLLLCCIHKSILPI